MAPLNLRLLGGFELGLEDGTRAALPAKACALLAYLAVHPGPHLRDKLAALLWGESTDAQARDSLRHATNLLRKTLTSGDRIGLVVDKQSYGIDRSVLTVDVGEFERLAGDAAGGLRAADLYKGDLLEGLMVNAAPFEEWLIAERERLREIAVETLGRVVADQSSRGQLDGAVQNTVRLLAIDPLQEAAHRTLMRLYARQGRRAAALRQYQTCVDVMRRELGVEPETATKQAYRDILSTSDAPVSPERHALPVAASKVPLVGREQELNHLVAELAQATRGLGRALMITGEAGVGKSRLVAELLGLASPGDHTILFGRCYESERTLPFSVWVQALRSSGVLTGGSVDTFHAAWRAELGRILPEFAVTTSGHAPTAEEHTRLFEAIVQLLGHLARQRPVIVVLEDVHWADAMSLRLLPFVARRVTDARVLITATARDEHVGEEADLRVVIAELDGQPPSAVIALHPLSREDTLGLVAAAEPRSRRAASMREQIWTLSEGNPFVALEAVQAIEHANAERIAVPDRVRGMIASRVERLSPGARELAAVAAVIGRDFDFPLLRDAAALDDRTTADPLEELVRRGIVRLAGDRFAFSHDRLRRAVYDDLIPPRRAALHLAVATTIERLHPGRLDELSERLGYHYAQTAETEQAIAYLMRFARQAGRRYALTDAVAALNDAETLAGKLPGPTQARTRIELLVAKADFLFYLGRFPLLLDALGRHADLVAQIDDPALAGRYHFWLALPLSLIGQHDAASANARLALAAAGRGGDVVTEGRAHAVLALEAFWSSHPIDGIESARRAIALLTGSGDDEWLFFAQFYVAVNAIQLGDLDVAAQANADATATAERTDSARLKTFAGWCSGWAHTVLGDPAAAAEICLRAAECAPDPLGAANALGFLGHARLEAGDAAGAVAALDAAVARAAEFGFRPQQGWFSAWLAEAYLAAGNVAAARECAARAVEISRQVAFPYGIGLALRARGRVAAAEFDVGTARGAFEEAAAIFSSIPARHEAGRAGRELRALDDQRLV